VRDYTLAASPYPNRSIVEGGTSCTSQPAGHGGGSDPFEPFRFFADIIIVTLRVIRSPCTVIL
jgi:hypothetical protein